MNEEQKEKHSRVDAMFEQIQKLIDEKKTDEAKDNLLLTLTILRTEFNKLKRRHNL